MLHEQNAHCERIASGPSSPIRLRRLAAPRARSRPRRRCSVSSFKATRTRATTSRLVAEASARAGSERWRFRVAEEARLVGAGHQARVLPAHGDPQAQPVQPAGRASRPSRPSRPARAKRLRQDAAGVRHRDRDDRGRGAGSDRRRAGRLYSTELGSPVGATRRAERSASRAPWRTAHVHDDLSALSVLSDSGQRCTRATVRSHRGLLLYRGGDPDAARRRSSDCEDRATASSRTQ